MTTQYKQKIQAIFAKVANNYDANARVYQEVGQRLLERLNYIKITPKVIVDLGCNTGFFAHALKKQFKKAQLLAVDIALPMLQQTQKRSSFFTRLQPINADIDYLPFADHSVDMIFSNLVLQWLPDLDHSLKECQRILKPNGLLLFATYGPDTLIELRNAWQTVDDYEHVNQFIDMHDIGDSLVQANFSDPVIDMEKLTLNYPSVKQLLKQLRAVGARSLVAEYRKTLTGKNRLQNMQAYYQKKFADQRGYIPATYEIVYGTAWGSDTQQQNLQRQDGSVGILLSSLKNNNTP